MCPKYGLNVEILLYQYINFIYLLILNCNHDLFAKRNMQGTRPRKVTITYVKDWSQPNAITSFMNYYNNFTEYS